MQKLLLVLFAVLLFSACEQQPYRMGERIYKANCANCHMDGGEGLSALIPPLSGSDYLAVNRDRLVCIVKNGLQDTIVVGGKPYSEQMPGNDKLNDIQITNVVNFVLKKWGGNITPLTFEEAQKALQKCSR